MNESKRIGATRNGIISELLAADPGIPSRTAARLLFAERPDLFTSIEIARNCIRNRTGNRGRIDHERMKLTHGYEYREPHTGSALPAPTPFWDSTPVVFDVDRCLILCDVHIPFHCNDVIEIATKYAIKHGAKNVLLNGDILDHYQESDFCRVPDVSTLAQELKDGKKFFEWLRKRFADRIVYKQGNHEERFDNKVHRVLPEVGRLLEGFCEEKMGLADLGVEIVKDRRRIDMGYLTVIHGHELGRGTSNLVNAARTMQLRAKTVSLCGHWHQPAQHRVRTLRQDHIGTWSVGCACILTPHYRPVNDWEHGFAVLNRTDTDGNFVLDNRTIIGGMVV